MMFAVVQSDYIDARERKDYETMSRLEEKYSGVRPNTGKRLQSPATFETPQDDPRETQDPRRPQPEPDNEFDQEEEEEAGEDNKGEEVGDKEDKMTLDQFMANNTSEDNESFIDIQTGELRPGNRRRSIFVFQLFRKREETSIKEFLDVQG